MSIDSLNSSLDGGLVLWLDEVGIFGNDLLEQKFVNSLGFVGVLLKWKVIEIVLSVSIDND
jgi:hypothetical protein